MLKKEDIDIDNKITTEELRERIQKNSGFPMPVLDSLRDEGALPDPIGLTYDEWFSFVKKDSRVLEFMPDNEKTQEICDLIIEGKNRGFGINNVPEKFLNDELVDKAISFNGYFIEDLPEKYITPERISKAVSINPWVIRNLKESDKKKITQENCLTAVKDDGRVYGYVPEEFRSPELALEAMQSQIRWFGKDKDHTFPEEGFKEALFDIAEGLEKAGNVEAAEELRKDWSLTGGKNICYKDEKPVKPKQAIEWQDVAKKAVDIYKADFEICQAHTLMNECIKELKSLGAEGFVEKYLNEDAITELPADATEIPFTYNNGTEISFVLELQEGGGCRLGCYDERFTSNGVSMAGLPNFFGEQVLNEISLDYTQLIEMEAARAIKECIPGADIQDFDVQKMYDQFYDNKGKYADSFDERMDAFKEEIKDYISEYCEMCGVQDKYAAELEIHEALSTDSYTEFSMNGTDYRMEHDDKGNLKLMEYDEFDEWNNVAYCDRETMLDVLKELIEEERHDQDKVIVCIQGDITIEMDEAKIMNALEHSEDGKIRVPTGKDIMGRTMSIDKDDIISVKKQINGELIWGGKENYQRVPVINCPRPCDRELSYERGL